MITVLLGLSMSLHLMAYQATESHYLQTLQANNYGPVCSVQWTYQA
jgi:hypothetical protein